MLNEQERDEVQPSQRGRAALVVVLVGLLLLALSLFRSQVLESGERVVTAREHRVRAVPLPAARGPILDRHGAALAESAPSLALILLPAPRDTLRSVLRRLAPLIDMEHARRQALEGQLSAGRPLLVATGLSFDQVSAVEEHRYALPRVLIEEWPVRRYPAGAATASVTGWVVADSTAAVRDAAGALAGSRVGAAGLEAAFDSLLRGKPGIRYVEVDAAGRIVRGAAGAPVAQPVPGDTLRITIDGRLQRFVAALAPDDRPSAYVVLEPATGAVLALHSTPVTGSDTAHGVTARRFAPGTLLQPITAAAALENGVLDPAAPADVPCRGGLQYGNRYFRCWLPRGHGRVDLAAALQGGCDVYFYQVGLRLGLERLLEAGARYRLAAETGIRLPAERAGVFPTGPDWIHERTGWRAGASDVLTLAAGRGPTELTLIRLAQFNAALANGGSAPPPRLVGQAGAPAWRLELEASSLARLLDAMARPTAAGAAAAGARADGWTARGQVVRWRPDRRDERATSAFVGMLGPAEGAPELVIGALIEGAAEEGQAAAHAGRIAEYYLRGSARSGDAVRQ